MTSLNLTKIAIIADSTYDMMSTQDVMDMFRTDLQSFVHNYNQVLMFDKDGTHADEIAETYDQLGLHTVVLAEAFKDGKLSLEDWAWIDGVADVVEHAVDHNNYIVANW